MVTMQDEEDRKIIMRLQRRDESALAELMAKYERYLHMIAVKTAGNWLCRQDIEEVVADVFVAVWESAYRIKIQEGYLRSYLAAITTNRTVDRIRKDRYKRMEISMWLSDMEMFAEEADIAETVINKLAFSEVRNTFACLSEAERNCFAEYYMDSDEAEEICERYHLSQNALRMTLRRASKKIRKVMHIKSFVAVAAAVMVSIGAVYAAGFQMVHQNRLLERADNGLIYETRYSMGIISDKPINGYDTQMDDSVLLLDQVVRVQCPEESNHEKSSHLQVDAQLLADNQYLIPDQQIVNNGMSVISDQDSTGWNLHKGDIVDIHFNLGIYRNQPQDLLVGYIQNDVLGEPQEITPEGNCYHMEIPEDGAYRFYVIGASTEPIMLRQTVLYINDSH